eukprot:1190925-Prorocentrum_minimum.AAC.3
MVRRYSDSATGLKCGTLGLADPPRKVPCGAMGADGGGGGRQLHDRRGAVPAGDGAAGDPHHVDGGADPPPAHVGPAVGGGGAGTLRERAPPHAWAVDRGGQVRASPAVSMNKYYK